MPNAQKATFEIGKSSEILHGDHHIVTAGKLAAGLTNLKAGLLLKESSEGPGIYTPVTLTGDTGSSIAVLNEDVEDSDEQDVAAVIVHGIVRTEKLFYGDTDASPIEEADISALRVYGIYCTKGVAENE